MQSNVVVNGSVSLDGNPGTGSFPAGLQPTEPGPGGFRGSASTSADGHFAGFGPGGLQASASGSASYTGAYGNPQILPLIGGSGADSGYTHTGASGGGAILVAAGSTVTISGQITANGQSTLQSSSSGGAVRIVANQILGAGAISADRTRIEANIVSSQLVITPNTVAVPPGATPTIWPATNTPVVTILSVNGAVAPSDPQAGLLTSSDVNISTNNAVNIILQSQNFPPSGSVVVRVTPKYSGYYNVNATYQSGTFSSALWVATTTLPNGFCVLQAHATSP